MVADRKVLFYKRMDTFARFITKDMTYAAYLSQQNNTIATLVKKYIVQMAYHEPFWDAENLRRTDSTKNYDYPYGAEEPNCFTEAIERECSLFSFPSEQFTKDAFTCKKDTEEIVVDNIKNTTMFLHTYLRMHPEQIKYILEHYPFEKRVVLACVGNRCYAEEALLQNELAMEDLQKILMNLPKMIDDKSNGRKTHWWDSIENNIYEYRVSVSSNREFRLFFVWEEKLMFLNGFVKKTQQTPESEKKKAREILRKMERG